MVGRLLIFSNLEYGGVGVITSVFAVTRGKSVPIKVDRKHHRFDNNEPQFDEHFRSFVRHLTWIANQTRPDILHAVRAVARYSAAPKSFHWQAALLIVMCIKSTRTCGIRFKRGKRCGVNLWLYVDSERRMTLGLRLAEL